MFKENPDIVKLGFISCFRCLFEPLLSERQRQASSRQIPPVAPGSGKGVNTVNVHVDDVVFGIDTEEEAHALFVNSREVLSHSSFNLRKFFTKSPTVHKAIGITESSQLNIELHVTIESGETFVESTLPTPCSLSDEKGSLGLDGMSSKTS